MAINGVPKDLAIRLAQAGGVRAFVETGTYKGDTTQWAAGVFEKVVTIEAHLPRYRKTKAGLGDKFANVKWCLGDSRTRLAKELKRLGEPAVLWLDAHWRGNYELSQESGDECALMDELEAVRETDIVLIDDARLFLRPPSRPHDAAQWPSYDEIKRALPGRYTAIVGDVIVSVPVKLAQIVRKETGVLDGPQAVCLTSNDYVNCLPAFAHMWLKFAGKNYPVKVARYDVKPPALPRQWFSQYAIGRQEDYSWTGGLVKFLEWWPEDLLILVLEDYWLSAPLDQEALNGLWRFMQANPEICKIDLSGDRTKTATKERAVMVGNLELVESTQAAPFRASVQAAIWRRDYLKNCAEKGDWAPWKFEKHAAQRDGARILGVIEPVMRYVNAVGGQGNKPGVFDRRKIPNWMWSELATRRAVS